MAYNGKIMAQARDALDRRRLKNEELSSGRRTEVYNRLPKARELECELSKLIIGVSLDALNNGKDAAAAVDGARSRANALEGELTSLLTGAGYAPNYLDDVRSCKKCSDYGYSGGRICGCLIRLYEEALYSELSSLPGAGKESFDGFDLSYYPLSDSKTGECPREYMTSVLDACKNYVERFGKTRVNLLFHGNTGLGKTYLSVCIARAVAMRGFSVVYETAVNALASFEVQRFLRGKPEGEQADARIRRYLECDLLIIDDLGTEMSGSFSSSSIYTLLNSRLISAKQMIISTNLGDEELRRRYTPQIVSRLDGDFLSLRFMGDDIRSIKKARGLK
jgi:DNA replication protein DnaC